MRISCESCGAKYVISDDKVRGKLFKFHCKKCKHVNVLRGQSVPEIDDEEKTQIYDTRAAAQKAGDVGLDWFYVLDGERSGPVSKEKIGELFNEGVILPETYIWSVSMEDWEHLYEIDQFSSLFGGEDGTPLSNVLADDDVARGEKSSNLSGERPELPDVPSIDIDSISSEELHLGEDDRDETKVDLEPAQEEPSSEGNKEHLPESQEDLSDAEEPAELEQFDFTESDESPWRNTDTEKTGKDGPLIASRNETSVLFSLDLLSEEDAEGEPYRNEASGLIDIRALAASEASRGGSDKLPELLDSSSNVALPIGKGHRNSLLYVVFALSGVVLLMLVALLALLVKIDSEESEDSVQVSVNSEESQPEETPEILELEPEETPLIAQGQGLAVAQARAVVTVATEVTGDISLRDQVLARDNDADSEVSRDNQETAEEEDPERAEDETDQEDSRVARERADSRSSREDEESRGRTASREEERQSRRSRDEVTEEEDDEADEDSRVTAALNQLRAENREDTTPSEEQEEEATETEEASSEESPSAGAEDVDDDLPEQLSNTQVTRTIRRYNRRLAQCRDVSGLSEGEVLSVHVDMTIHGTGRVAAASTGASDEASQCVVSVVRDMRFPQFSQDRMTFTYPFRLR